MISLSLLLSSHLRIFQHSRVRSSTVCYHSFNLLKSRSPPLRVYCRRLNARFALAFASPPPQRGLGWPPTITRRLIMQKAGCHPCGLQHIVCNRFQVLLTPLAGVLFTFPSRYWFTIGCRVVFSLVRWSGPIHAEFHVHRITWDTPGVSRTSRTRLSRSLAGSSKPLRSRSSPRCGVPQPRGNKFPRFGLIRFRSPLLTESVRFLFLGLLRCFTSPRFALQDYEFIPQ